MIESKSQFLVATVQALHEACEDPAIQGEFDKVMDSLVHTAPEILDRCWLRMYSVCSQHLTNASDPTHTKCFRIYTDRYRQYKELYKI